jgi:hypothetical protein
MDSPSSGLSTHTYNRQLVPDADVPPYSNSEAKPGGYLLKLPAELRVTIFDQMFLPDTIIAYAINGSLHKAADGHHVAGGYIGLLATCRTIYTEAKPFLYANTEFNIHVRDRLSNYLWPKADARKICGVLYGRSANWLDNPRSIVPVNQARVLTLTMETSTGVRARSKTWTQDLINTLNGISDLQKLHIALRASNPMPLSQRATDLVLSTVAQTIKCNDTVTAEMDPSLGSNFDSAGYYRMHAVFGG